jgi:heme exporter protein D
MRYAEFVFSGYALTLGSIGAYAWWVVRRGRALSAQVPAERRRFLD